MDTEGSVTRVGRGYGIIVSQDEREREALEDYCDGTLRDGISRCEIRCQAPHVLGTRIARTEDVAKEIVLTRPCIRTKARHRQIEGFTRFLTGPRRKLEAEIIRARQILGLPPILPEEAPLKRKTKKRRRGV